MAAYGKNEKADLSKAERKLPSYNGDESIWRNRCRKIMLRHNPLDFGGRLKRSSAAYEVLSDKAQLTWVLSVEQLEILPYASLLEQVDSTCDRGLPEDNESWHLPY